MNSFKNAPLPFQGQKRNFVKVYKSELSKRAPAKIYVDLFGGSGLLSRVTKDCHPNSKVIYNDYDNYKKRLMAIPNTNLILSDLRKLVEGVESKKKIPKALKEQIIDRLSNEAGFVDYITISASILFSMKYVTSLDALKKETLYNNIRKSNYNNCSDYLEGIDVVSCDYKDVFEKYKNYSDVVFLVDPPYLSTDCSSYSGGSYWGLKDYLDILKVIKDHSYFYFTSNKSSVVELCEWIGDNTNASNPFEGATIKTHFTTMSATSSYTDIMLFNWVQTTT